MIKAEALFKRHAKQFKEILELTQNKDSYEDQRAMLSIYTACIIAEAIRNDGEDFEARLVPGKVE